MRNDNRERRVSHPLRVAARHGPRRHNDLQENGQGLRHQGSASKGGRDVERGNPRRQHLRIGRHPTLAHVCTADAMQDR